MSLQPGQILHNRYQIQGLLGQGGMGAVYLARDAVLEHKVAVKEMRPDPQSPPSMLDGLRQQFQREARVLAGLTHPNLPRVTDYFSEGSNEYLVMDYIEGQSLNDVLKAQGRPGLPETQVVDWARQLLDALEYIHSKNVLHRDIKPANIRLTPEGRVVLVDFGLVKLYDPHSPQTVLVLRGAGTPQYAPPEQIDGTYGHTDARSDLFSLGATLYYLLTGKLPPSITERLIKQTPIPPLWTQSPGVSSTTEAAILKAMQLRPEDRFQSAAEMRAALSPPVRPAALPPTYISPTPPSRPAPPPVTPPPVQVAPPARKSGLPAWVWLGGCGGLLALGACLAVIAFLALSSAGISPTPTPLPRVLYSDDFSDPSSGWEEREGDNAITGYADGKYFIMVTKDQYIAWETAGQSFGDISIEVEATVSVGDQDTDYGIICRYQDSDNFYVLQVSADGTAAIRKREKGGSFTLISGEEWQASEAIRPDLATNQLKAVCQGEQLILYVNGVQVVKATDRSFPMGDVGLAAGTFGAGGILVEFDNLIVREP